MPEQTATHPRVFQLDPTPKKLKIKMALHGASGVGKTRLASDIARHFKTFYMSSEKSEATFYSNPNFDQIRENLDLMHLSSWSDVQEAFGYISENPDKYDWVIADSLTEINRIVKDNILIDSKDETLSMRQWGKVSVRMEKFVRYLRDLPTNILFICLTTGEENKLTGEVKMYPSLTGKLKEELSGFTDITGYMYTHEDPNTPNQVQRAVQFTNTPRAIAKDRFDKLTFEPADMTMILRKLGLL